MRHLNFDLQLNCDVDFSSFLYHSVAMFRSKHLPTLVAIDWSHGRNDCNSEEYCTRCLLLPGKQHTASLCPAPQSNHSTASAFFHLDNSQSPFSRVLWAVVLLRPVVLDFLGECYLDSMCCIIMRVEQE